MAIRINGDNTTAAPGITRGDDTDTGIQFGTDEISIVTGGSEKVKVDSSGNLGLGVSSPSYKLDLDNGQARINRGNSAGDILILRGQNSEKAKFDTDGLKFNGDTAAANALDDYEEGEWTVTLRGGSVTSPTYTATPLASGAHNARYVKIGNKVFFHFYERWNISSWSGSWNGLNFDLPFTPDNYAPITISYWSQFFNVSLTSGFVPGGYLDPNGLCRLTLQSIRQAGESDNNNGTINLSHSSSGLMISGIYTTA